MAHLKALTQSTNFCFNFSQYKILFHLQLVSGIFYMTYILLGCCCCCFLVNQQELLMRRTFKMTRSFKRGWESLSEIVKVRKICEVNGMDESQLLSKQFEIFIVRRYTKLPLWILSLLKAKNKQEVFVFFSSFINETIALCF